MPKIRCASLRDDTADSTRSGKADDRDGLVLRERSPRVRAVATDQVNNAAGGTCLGKYLHEMIGGKRRIFCRLQHDGVSADEGRHHLPRRNGHGKIPRCDHPADADGLPHAHGELVGQFGRRGLAKQPAAFSGHVIRHVDGFLHVPARLGKNLAHFAGAKQNLRALGRRHEPPRFVGFRGGVHRQVDIFVAGGDKHSHQLVRIRGVTILVGFTGTRFHPFAVDEVLKNPRGNCRGHTSSWLPT